MKREVKKLQRLQYELAKAVSAKKDQDLTEAFMKFELQLGIVFMMLERTVNPGYDLDDINLIEND